MVRLMGRYLYITPFADNFGIKKLHKKGEPPNYCTEMQFKLLCYLFAFFISTVECGDEWFSVWSVPQVENPQSYQEYILYPTRWEDGYLFQLADQSLYETPWFHYDKDANQIFVIINAIKYYIRAVEWYLAATLEAPPPENSFSFVLDTDGYMKMTQNPLTQPITFVWGHIDGEGTYVRMHNKTDGVTDPDSIFELFAQSNTSTHHNSDQPSTVAPSTGQLSTGSATISNPNNPSATDFSASSLQTLSGDTPSSNAVNNSQGGALSSVFDESSINQSYSKYLSSNLVGGYEPPSATASSHSTTSTSSSTTTSRSSSSQTSSSSSSSLALTDKIFRNDADGARMDKAYTSIASVVLGFLMSLIA